MRLPAKLLTHLAAALERPAKFGRFPAKQWSRIVKSGWAYSSEVEDVFLAMDGRVYGLPIDTIADHAAFPTRYVRQRPRFASAEWVSNQAIAASDVAGLCIFLEQLGFAVDPAPMVESLLDQVAKQTTMTMSEAEIFCFTKFRHRQAIKLLAVETLLEIPEQRTWKGYQGYRYSSLMRGGQVAMLKVHGPKFRPMRRSEVNCPVCGMRYTKGDPESALSHRKEHARVTRLLSPRPSQAMRTRLTNGMTGERVDSKAPLWMHREVYERAVRFKRDFQYDFIQWPTVGARANLDDAWVGYLFAAVDGAVDGACAFQNTGGEWRLGWVWIRPERRRHGLLAERWEGFLQEFGDFWIEHPLSEAMLGFVEKYASPGQRRLIIERTGKGCHSQLTELE